MCDFNKVAKLFIEITHRHACSPVNLLLIFRTPFLKNTSERLDQSIWKVIAGKNGGCMTKTRKLKHFSET